MDSVVSVQMYLVSVPSVIRTASCLVSKSQASCAEAKMAAWYIFSVQHTTGNVVAKRCLSFVEIQIPLKPGEHL